MKKNNFSKVKYVLIDIDDTILDFKKCAYVAMHKAAEENNIVVPDNFADVFHRINNGLWEKVEQGLLTPDNLHNIRWNIIFKETGIEFDGVAFEKTFKDVLKNTAIPVDGAEDLLKYLNSKYVVATASNSAYAQQVRRLGIAGFSGYFKKIFVSEKIGATKPTPEFFRGCMEGLCGDNADIEEFVMIGDSPSADIAGAHDMGMKTVWFNKKQKPKEEGSLADAYADRLEEIRHIL